jgi:DnaJ family protein C protein 17
MRQKDEQARAAQDALDPLDTTVRLKWQRKQFPAFELDKEAIIQKLPIKSSSIESIVISGKMAANPKLKAGTAMVALKTLTAAVTLVDGTGKGNLDGIDITWATGKEPQAVMEAR